MCNPCVGKGQGVIVDDNTVTWRREEQQCVGLQERAQKPRST